MNWVDILIVAIIGLTAWLGWSRGFILGSLDLIKWGGSLVLGFLFYPYMIQFFETVFNDSAWLLPVAFIVTLLIARVLLGVLVRLVVRTIPERVNESGLNRIFGILPGAFIGFAFAVILSALLLALPLKDSITNETRTSRLAGPLAMQSQWFNKKLAPVFDAAVRQTMNRFNTGAETKHFVPLAFTHQNPQVRVDLEASMLVMVNAERAKAGLKPLAADPELSNVARAHSKDMFARGYFSHDSPDGKDPFDRMKDANVKFLTAGENLALAQTLELAHKNLMNSPGHRENIMNPAYGRLGIGIQDGGFYGIMVSQEFRN